MTYENILYETVEPGIVKITLNRPEKRNAIDNLTIEEVEDAFVEADLDEDVRVILLGAAGKDFCAGYDISGRGKLVKHAPKKTIMATKLTGMEKRLKQTEYMCFNHAMTIRNVSKPTIAIVQGNCIGAGLLYSSMCDIIFASEDAQFVDPLSRWAHAGFEVLVEPYNLGFRKAKAVMWTGDPVTAQEAKEGGMVLKVCPREKLQEEAMIFARKIAKNPPVTISLIKRSVNQAWDLMGQRFAWNYHLMAHELSHASDESIKWEETRSKARAEGNAKIAINARDSKFTA